ncbi:unnamed protein product, partial [marine sediment metagenome]
HTHDTYLQLIGGSMTGDITLVGDPTQPLHPATKQYVDGIQAGLHTIATEAPAGPNVGDVWVNPDAQDENAYLPLNGTVPMQGDLDMGGFDVVNTGSGTAADEYSAKMRLGSNWPLVSGNSIDWDVTIFDNGGMADLANNRFNIPKTGVYLITLAVFFQGNPSGDQSYFQVRRNGGNGEFPIIRRNWSTGFITSGPDFSSMIMKLNAGDFIDVTFTGTANSAQLRSGSQVGSHFAIAKM